jgi:cytochrome c peroxidase
VRRAGHHPLRLFIAALIWSACGVAGAGVGAGEALLDREAPAGIGGDPASGPASGPAPTSPSGPDPVTDAAYRAVDQAAARLGRLLFHDPILSGNRNISCAGCHRGAFATSDGLALGLGEGGVGVGPARRADPANPPERLIPRNAQALFNLGAHEFRVMFHDGRVEEDAAAPHGIRTPLAEDMAKGFDGVLSAQTMFPVLSPDEMAGQYGENDISRAVRMGLIAGPDGAWALLAARVAAIPAYAALGAQVYPDARPLGFADIANAIAAFIAQEWRSDDSAFDAHSRGQAPLQSAAAQGMALFYGEAGCAACHAGPFQTDHGFHAMGMPQIGPGKALAFERHSRDTGRMLVTGRAADAYRFRTPSLRNVAHTGPWGHDGAYRALPAFLAGHGAGGAPYDPGQAALPALEGGDPARDDPDARVAAAATAAAATAAAAIAAAAIAAAAIAEGAVPPRAEWIAPLIAFLGALSDPAALSGRMGAPDAVPSGLPPGL